MKYNVIIKKRDTQEIREVIPCGNYKNAEKVLLGINYNLNHNNYFAFIEEE